MKNTDNLMTPDYKDKLNQQMCYSCLNPLQMWTSEYRSPEAAMEMSSWRNTISHVI